MLEMFSWFLQPALQNTIDTKIDIQKWTNAEKYLLSVTLLVFIQ